MHSSRLYLPRQECFVTVQRMRNCGSSATPGLPLSYSCSNQQDIITLLESLWKSHNVNGTRQRFHTCEDVIQASLRAYEPN